jgi:hypothetical protein
MPIDTPVIAICLAVFFLLAALINTLVNRSRRRRIENQRAARTGGGTEDAPIHLTTPFTPGQSSAPSDPFSGGAPAQPTPSPTPTAAAAPQKPQDDEYVWE